jgi:hypothetical protein
LTDKPTKSDQGQDEMAAMSAVFEALRPLDAGSQRWILRSIIDRFGLGTLNESEAQRETHFDKATTRDSSIDKTEPQKERPAETSGTANIDTSGISPVAQKWMARSGLDTSKLSAIYSLNFDEIDLISQSVPGTSMRERMKNVLLLKSIASYLGTGAARVPYDKAKEACIHYNAYDQSNFASYLKEFAREIGGTKESGYSLTPAGMTAATGVIQQMLASPQQAGPQGNVGKRRRPTKRAASSGKGGKRR